MTPIERAARALCASSLEDPDEVVATLGEKPGEPVFAWQHRLHDVRAVLTEIREPSEHAMDCGAYRLPGIDTATKQAKARDVYRAMIDAMLEEG